MGFSAAIRKLFVGTPFGDVQPPRPDPPPVFIDGRTAALRVLRQYISEITFYRAGPKGRGPEPFQIPEKNFFIEWPSSEVDLVLPAIAVIPARATYEAIGLNGYVDESTADVYAPGTVVAQQSELTEHINLQIWASQSSERRGIFAGLEKFLSPTEQYYGLRLKMSEYYDQTVCFTLWSREVIDSEESGRNRRLGMMELEMRFNVVALVNINRLKIAPVWDIGPEVRTTASIARETSSTEAKCDDC